MTYHKNPKIWLGCDMLSYYVNIRPKDLLNLKEEDVDVNNRVLIIKRPSKARGQIKKLTVRLIYQHVEEIKNIRKRYPSIPNDYFFRHMKGISGVKENSKFGEKYFYKYWMNCGVTQITPQMHFQSH